MDGSVVCNAANTQSGAVAVSDGAGGVIVAWVDGRTAGAPRIFVQRVSPTGVPLWPANGVAISTAFSNEVAIASDGAGGAVVAWSAVGAFDDLDIFAQRVQPGGTVAWAAGGVVVCGIGNTISAINQVSPAVCPDGGSGAFIAWDDGRGPSHDIYAQHLNGSGVAQWAANGVPVCTNASDQTVPVITSGTGGTSVAMWLDARNGNPDVFAQRINDPAGAAGWTVDGVAVCNAAGKQSDLRALPDGAGAYAAWTDERAGVNQFNAYLQRLNAATGAGTLAANGQLVSAIGAGYKLRPSIVASGTGPLVVWQDHRNGFDDLYGQRFDSNGIELWANGGVRLTDLPNHQEYTSAASDGAGGAFVACRDLRAGGVTVGMVGHVDLDGNLAWPINGTFTNATSPTNPGIVVADGLGGALFVWTGASSNDVFAQRVVASSNLADYDAVVSSISDLPNDEGGFVRIATSGAIGDAVPGSPPVTGYNVWRQIGAGAQAATSTEALGAAVSVRGPGLAALAAAGVPGAPVRLDPLVAASLGFPGGSWESLGFNASRGQSSYVLAVATPADSSGLGSADRTYVLTVHTTVPSIYAVSNTKAGHSVDNLAPAAPQNVTGQKTGPTSVFLQWSANGEADLARYAVYRGTNATFVPAPGNRIGTPTATSLTDDAFAASYYKVSALDRHGNESAFALLDPGTIVGVPGGDRPGASALGAPAPNPFRATTTVALALAVPGHASVRVFDPGGRRVRTLLDDALDAGVYPLTWDGRDERGHAVAAGVYLIRGEFGGDRWTRRVLVAR